MGFPDATTKKISRFYVTLTGNEVKRVTLGGATAIFVSKMVALGTSAGEIEIAFGRDGDYIALSPGDFIEFENFREVYLRNALGLTRSVELVIAYDRTFRWNSLARGL